jgi:uncharacterized protein YbjQ (UPF0145 family)
LDPALTTTAFTLDGHSIVGSLGVVRGVTEVLCYGTAVFVALNERN